MISEPKHKWSFSSKFRHKAFGWRSSRLAVERIKEALAEIKLVSKSNPVLGAEGAVIFLEKLSPALEQVDSSSGALGTAVYNAIAILVRIIAKAPVDDIARNLWLTRLWQAIEDDDMPYLEALIDHWGELCVTPEIASFWADEFIEVVKMIWAENSPAGGYFQGTAACLSALFTAGRYAEIIELLALAPYDFWHYRQWGVKALVAMGKKADALRLAEESRSPNESPTRIAEACEEILLSSGMSEEAYCRYAIQANQKSTYVATFKAIAKKYPGKKAEEILDDLIASTPGNEGKWFAAAKSVGLYDKAIELVNRAPCDPKTLIRAARDMADSNPQFAIDTALAALHYIVAGYGYEISGGDVLDAFHYAMKGAEKLGTVGEVIEGIRELVAGKGENRRFVREVIGRRLG